MIIVEKYTDLHTSTKKLLGDMVEREFGHIPIVNETIWSVPDWTFMTFIDKQIAAFYNIVLRNIDIDGSSYLAAGKKC